MNDKNNLWRALGVTPWTVGKSLSQTRRASHSAKLLDVPTMGTSKVFVFENQRDPFYSSHGASRSSDLESFSASTPSTTVDFDSDETVVVSGSNHRKQSANQAYALERVRLSLVGLGLPSTVSSCMRSTSTDEQKDELHSNLYSSVLETVRVQLIECVHQVNEEMISRAIINAFADSKVQQRGRDAGPVEAHRDEYQVEVDYLWRAQEYAQLWGHQKKEAPGEEAQAILQELLDDIFLQIRREVFTASDQVMRAVLAFASIIGLEIDKSDYMHHDTIVLQGLPKSVTRKGLWYDLSSFGEVQALAISSRNHGYAYCRFREESAALQAVAHKSSLVIDGAKPSVTILQESRTEGPTSNRMEWNGSSDLVGKTTLRVDGDDPTQVSPVCISKHIGDAYWKHDAVMHHVKQIPWGPH